MKPSSLVRGQRVFLRRIPGQIVDIGFGQATVELDDGRIELVPRDQVVTAESPESVRKRQAAT